MKRIIIDIDGVLADFQPAAHAVLSTVCEMQPLNDGPTMWDWFAHYGATAEAQQKLSDAMHTHEFWRDLLIHGDVGTLDLGVTDYLLENDEVTFVTARPMGRATTEQWLAHQLENNNIQVVLTPHRKVMALVAMEPDVIIEDSARTLIDFAGAEKDYHLPPCTKILISRKYNEVWHDNCRRLGIQIVGSTGEALQMAQEVVKK